MVLIFANFLFSASFIFKNGYFYNLKKKEDKTFIQKRDLNRILWQKKIDSPFVRDIKYYKGFLYFVFDYENHFVLEKISAKDGREVFKKEFASGEIDFAFSLDLDKDAIFITGGSSGNLASLENRAVDIIVLRLSLDGDLVWKKLFGGEFDDWGKKISAFKDFIFIAAQESKKDDPRDVVLIKMDKNANIIFEKNLSSKREDLVKDLYIDKRVYIYGESWGDFEGIKNRGFSDLFLASFSMDGKDKRVFGFGSETADNAYMLIGDENFLYFSLKADELFYSYSNSGFFAGIFDKKGKRYFSIPLWGDKIAVDNNYLYILEKNDKINRYKKKNLYKISMISKFYTQFFKRAPKKHEISYWLSEFDKNIEKSFLYMIRSFEFVQKNETLPKYFLIKYLYRVLLNREPSNRAIDFWSSFDKERILKGILHSKEFKELIESF